MDNQLVLAPGQITVLSKENAIQFHSEMKAYIFETGNGLFEYIEAIKFCAKLNDVVFGNSASKIEADKEFVSYICDQIKLNGEKEILKTPRGVKFECAETGTSYDFAGCNDSKLLELEEAAKIAADKLKERKDFLKTIPTGGLIITDEASGDTYTVYAPSKTSKSSFKVTLPK